MSRAQRVLSAIQAMINQEEDVAAAIMSAEESITDTEISFSNAEGALRTLRDRHSQSKLRDGETRIAAAETAVSDAKTALSEIKVRFDEDLRLASADSSALISKRTLLSQLLVDPNQLAETTEEELDDILAPYTLNTNLPMNNHALPTAEEATLQQTRGLLTRLEDRIYQESANVDEEDAEDEQAESEEDEASVDMPDQKFLRKPENWLKDVPCIVRHPDGYWCEISCPYCHGNSRKMAKNRKPDPPCENCGHVKAPPAAFLKGGYKGLVDHAFNAHNMSRTKVDCREFISKGLVRKFTEDEVEAIREGRDGAYMPTPKMCFTTDRRVPPPSKKTKTKKGGKRKAEEDKDEDADEDGEEEMGGGMESMGSRRSSRRGSKMLRIDE